MKIKEITSIIEEFAPLSLQENYDNSGLQVGNADQEISGLLLCLDVTESVIDEAIKLSCNLIISHHPVLFKPVKSLIGKNYIERCIIKACQHQIAIYSAHTNLDNAFDGVSFKIAEKIGLQNTRVLMPQKDALLKLVTFVPIAQAEQVRSALFEAGAGQIGDYDSCSYNLEGEGSFRAGKNANPFCGATGDLHFERETRIEIILPVYKKNTVVRALLSSHPYEEPAYDIYALENTWNKVGSGIIGELPVEENEMDFLQKLKNILNLKCIQHSALRNKKIRKIAICGGSGSFLYPEAIRQKADVFITGEAKYNDFYDVEKNILLATIGHYESEIFTKEIFFEIITKKIPNFAIHFSDTNSNPVNYLI